MRTNHRPVAIPVTLTVAVLALASCSRPDTTSPFGIGTVIGTIGVIVAVTIWASAKSDELPDHRHPEGPAAAAAKARAARTRAWAFALIAISIASILWGFDDRPMQHLLLVLFAAAMMVLAGTIIHRQTTIIAGAELAEERWIRQAEAAERAGEPTPPEPVATAGDLHSLGLTKGFERPDDSAAAVLLDPAGRPRPLHAVWAAVARSQGMGKTDENGHFTSWARIDEVVTEPNGDVVVYWQLLEIGKTAGSMSACKSVLQHELRVKEMSSFETEHATGRVFARFSNGGGSAPAGPAGQAPKAAPAPRPAPADDDWDL